jgi:hypothetical protein
MHGLFSILLVPALSLSVLALPSPVLAQDAPAVETAAPPAPVVPKPVKRLKWQERFAQADTAHDGHLTLEEAKAGYATVAKNFQSIDVDGKGYVTEEDIRAWHALRRATKNRSQLPEDELRPRKAYQRDYPDQRRPLNTSTTTQVTSGQ